MNDLLLLSIHFNTLKGSGRLNTGIGMTRVFIKDVRFVRLFWNRAGGIIPIHIASCTLYTVSLCDAINCFAEVQYKSPTALCHDREARPNLLGGRRCTTFICRGVALINVSP
jgi:hypothetical protein